MTSTNPDKTYDQVGAVQLVYALNAVGTTLQQSIESEQNVYAVFRREVVGLGLRGGISLLDETRQVLEFKIVASSNPISKILSKFEKESNVKAEGYKIRIAQVDVYHKVITEGLAVFVPDTSTVSTQVIPRNLQSLIRPILAFLGSPPGIFAPLIFDGEVKGMLNIVGPNLAAADLLTMQAFANQIAVALENARLINKLQKARNALEIAYQKTLDGWVKALDLRDKETEGHTMRVADMTVKLAEAMGVDHKHLNCIRVGALLHDIGKMSIPDNILLKSGPLTEAEWDIMREHPKTACSWVEGIDYLKPALDIPYCHHEHWDGSGYPQGLVGEQIPFAARVFSVVDAWDAMRSDRPYRDALSHEEVIAQIKAESGSHFDPSVVRKFLKLLDDNTQGLFDPNRQTGLQPSWDAE